MHQCVTPLLRGCYPAEDRSVHHREASLQHDVFEVSEHVSVTMMKVPCLGI